MQQDTCAYYKGDISAPKLVAGMLHMSDMHTLSAFARRQLKTRALPGVTPLQWACLSEAQAFPKLGLSSTFEAAVMLR
jgi:hypothetical protein